MSIGQIITVLHDNKDNFFQFTKVLFILMFVCDHISNTFVNICVFTYMCFSVNTFLKKPTLESLPLVLALKGLTAFMVFMIIEYFLGIFLGWMYIPFIANSIKIAFLMTCYNGKHVLSGLYDSFVVQLFNTIQRNCMALSDYWNYQAVNFRNSQRDLKNYDLMNYLKPYVDQVKKFTSTVNVKPKQLPTDVEPPLAKTE
jgi:hypothetical protein